LNEDEFTGNDIIVHGRRECHIFVRYSKSLYTSIRL